MTVHALRVPTQPDHCACRCPDNGHKARACLVEPVSATLDGVRLCAGCAEAIARNPARSDA